MRFGTYFIVLLEYLLIIGATNRYPDSEETPQMKKSLIFSIAITAGLSAAPVKVDELSSSRSVKIEENAYAVYTPSMATC